MNTLFLAFTALTAFNTGLAMNDYNPFLDPLLNQYSLVVNDNTSVSIHNNPLITEQGWPVAYDEQNKQFIGIQTTENNEQINVPLTIKAIANTCAFTMRRFHLNGHTDYTGSISSTSSTSIPQQDNRLFHARQPNQATLDHDNAQRETIGSYVRERRREIENINASTVAEQQLAKLAPYSPTITATAAITGIITEKIAKNFEKSEKGEKKAFFAGVGATSVASLIGQRLQQGEHTPGRVFTQVAIDAAVYTAIHHVTNYFFSTAKKQKTDPETAKSSSHNARG